MLATTKSQTSACRALRIFSESPFSPRSAKESKKIPLRACTHKESFLLSFIGQNARDDEVADFGVQGHFGFFPNLFFFIFFIYFTFNLGTSFTTTYSGRLKILGIRVDSLANPRLTIIVALPKSYFPPAYLGKKP